MRALLKFNANGGLGTQHLTYIIISDLRSISYSDRCLDSVRKLYDDQALQRVHIKYWGKCVEDEVEKWWTTPESYIITGRGLEATSNEDEETDDDEVGLDPNCCVLTIDTPLHMRRKIWVREEYVRMYDCFEARHQEFITRDHSTVTVLTGQPGIGEFNQAYTANIYIRTHV